MRKKKIIKIISIAIFTLLVFQMIPAAITSADGFQSHAQNSKAFLSAGTFNTDVLLANRESQKKFQNGQIKNTLIYTNQIFIEDISAVNLSFREMSFDYRKVIRRSIPNYFNGSKYKEPHLAI